MQIYHFSRDCVSAWNRAAGVQFLRLGLSLFEQEVSNFKSNKLFFKKMPLINIETRISLQNPKGNQLEILNVFTTEFQNCW